MAVQETTSKNHHANEQKRVQFNANRPLLVQKFSVASKELRNLPSSTEVSALSTIDFYVDGKGSDRRPVGQMSPEEPEGRLFNTKGEPVILASGEQHRYLDERKRKEQDPNGKYEFLKSVEQQHGGPLRFERWYIDLFSEDRLRDAQMADFIDMNEQLRSVYGSREIRKTPSSQEYYDQKHGISQVNLDDNAATQ